MGHVGYFLAVRAPGLSIDTGVLQSCQMPSSGIAAERLRGADSEALTLAAESEGEYAGLNG